MRSENSPTPRRTGRQRSRAMAQNADPIARFAKWLADAVDGQGPQAVAMALATVGADGQSSVRFVLLKAVDDRGFVFYTDMRSPKGRDLKRDPRASLAFYWHSTDRQVRIAGTVEPVSDAEADEYWASRPRASRLSGSVSQQSAHLANRRILEDAVAELRSRLKGKDIPRPSYWGGFRLIPKEIEFWTQVTGRLHIREMYRRAGKSWKMTLLQP